MACTRIQHQPQQLPAAPLLLLLLLAFLAQPCSCRPLRPLDNSSSGSNAATNVILLPLPAETAAAGGGAADAPSAPREEHQQRQEQLAGRHQWLLNKKPRAKAQPSAPSKRTN